MRSPCRTNSLGGLIPSYRTNRSVGGFPALTCGGYRRPYLKMAANSVDGLEIQHGKFRSLNRLCLVLKVVGTSVLKIKDGARLEIITLQLICKDLVGLFGIKITHLRGLKEIAIHPEVTGLKKQEKRGKQRRGTTIAGQIFYHRR